MFTESPVLSKNFYLLSVRELRQTSQYRFPQFINKLTSYWLSSLVTHVFLQIYSNLITDKIYSAVELYINPQC